MLNTKHLISNNISHLLSNLSTYAAYTAHPSESSRLKHLFLAGHGTGEGGHNLADACARALFSQILLTRLSFAGGALRGRGVGTSFVLFYGVVVAG